MSTELVLYLVRMDKVYIPQPISKEGAWEGWNIQVPRNVASPMENWACISSAPSSPLSQAHCEAIDCMAFQNIDLAILWLATVSISCPLPLINHRVLEHQDMLATDRGPLTHPIPRIQVKVLLRLQPSLKPNFQGVSSSKPSITEQSGQCPQR